VRTGIVVFGHGSSVSSANDAVRNIAERAAREGSWNLFETAFLEADPRLREAVSNLTARGAEEVLVVPYFLTLGIHLQRDLPRLVDDLSREQGIPIRVSDPLDGHPELSRILVARAAELLTGKGTK
jgi:sirohydrochlorin ferrochelatase